MPLQRPQSQALAQVSPGRIEGRVGPYIEGQDSE